MVDVFAAQALTVGQEVDFQDQDGFEVGEVTSNCFTTTLDGIATDQATGTVRLQALTGDITQTQAITANALGVEAQTGTIDLSLATNSVNTFAALATASGQSIGWSVEGSIGGPISSSGAPEARWAAAGEKRSRPWKVDVSTGRR